jgi:serine/threonine protein phosphatase PrpC
MWYAIVSDGCSSAEYSEIGAQVLCHTTKNILMVYYDLFLNGSVTPGFIAQLLENSIRIKADEVRKIYPISRNSLQATLLISVIVKREGKKNQAFIFAWGDGVIIHSYKLDTELISVEEIDFPNTNAPVYLMTDLEAYKNKFPLEDCIKRSRSLAIGKDHLKILDCSKSFTHCFEEQKLSIFNDPIIKCFSIEPGDFIVLATDGLSQYQDQNKKPVELLKMAQPILDYPNYNGQFVKRTMNFMKRDLARKGWAHSDDIGIATIINL